MAFGLIFVLVAFANVKVEAKIPEGYIMQVTPSCGTDVSQTAYINIVTDLVAEAKAVCNGGTSVAFNDMDGVNHVLAVSYPGGSESCMFVKRKEAEVYTVTVLVSWGEAGRLIHSNEEEYQVTCTFDEQGGKESVTKSTGEGLVAAGEIQSHNGNATISTLTLAVVDVLGKITQDAIVLGRKVRLKATTDGSNGEQGIRPDGCDAVGATTGKRYAVLRAGCGDGIVFPKNIGFKTMGRTSMSPYFEAFNFLGDTSVCFECNFTLCNSSCEGCSCDPERRRRSADLPEESTGLQVIVESKPVNFINRYAKTGKTHIVSGVHNISGSLWLALLMTGAMSLSSLVMWICTCVKQGRTYQLYLGKA